MDPLLVNDWLAGEDALPILDEASVAVARQAARDRGTARGLGREAIERLALAVSELGHNQLRHATRGWMAYRDVMRDGVPGVEVVAADSGPGVAHPERALKGGFSTAGTLGVGLSGVRSAVDEMDVDVRLGEGTCVMIRCFAAKGRRRREVGIFGRPHARERVSGDGAQVLRTDRALIVAVVDGLGHGEPAREAARAATAGLRGAASLSLSEQLLACDRAAGGTRGVVMTIAEIEEPLLAPDADLSVGEALRVACAGNVTAMLSRHREERRLGGMAATLGAQGARPLRPQIESTTIDRRQLFVLYTDGVTSRLTFESEPQLLFQHPVVIAAWAVERYGRDSDDALVLVAR